jgi:hypothetical protein
LLLARSCNALRVYIFLCCYCCCSWELLYSIKWYFVMQLFENLPLQQGCGARARARACSLVICHRCWAAACVRACRLVFCHCSSVPTGMQFGILPLHCITVTAEQGSGAHTCSLRTFHVHCSREDAMLRREYACRTVAEVSGHISSLVDSPLVTRVLTASHA